MQMRVVRMKHPWFADIIADLMWCHNCGELDALVYRSCKRHVESVMLRERRWVARAVSDELVKYGLGALGKAFYVQESRGSGYVGKNVAACAAICAESNLN